MDKTVQMDTKQFITYYDSCSLEVRESLKGMFKDIINRYLIFSIKSYENASNRVYGKIVQIDNNTFDIQSNAAMKLNIITRALNDGWKVSGIFYYPIFMIKGNTFNFSEVKAGKYILEEGQEFPNQKPFFGLYRDPELAEHSGKTFLNLWRDFYLGGGSYNV